MPGDDAAHVAAGKGGCGHQGPCLLGGRGDQVFVRPSCGQHIGQAHVDGGFSPNLGALLQEPQRPRCADAPGQGPHGPHVRHQADTTEAGAEPRAGGGDHAVAAQRQRHAAAIGHAIDGRDDRFRAKRDQPHNVMHHVQPGQRDVDRLAHALDVAAGAKTAAGPGQHDAADGRILVRGAQGIAQLGPHLVAKRIPAFGLHQAKDPDLSVLGKVQAVGGHRVNAAPCGRCVDSVRPGGVRM